MSAIGDPFDRLDKKQILAMIKSESQRQLKKMEIFDRIDSTNTYLLQQIATKAVSGWVCFAEQQTLGRGRLGRQWYSPPGANIYCSLLWHFSEENCTHLSLAVAVMVRRVLHQYGEGADFMLKWPNDVLVKEKKLAGILLERIGSFVVIGIGINVFLPNAISALLIPHAIALADVIKENIDRNRLAGLLLNELLTALPVYVKQGFSPFLSEWHQYDALYNQHIIIQHGQMTMAGRMQGVNEQGDLLLVDADNVLHCFKCGEVTIGK